MTQMGNCKCASQYRRKTHSAAQNEALATARASKSAQRCKKFLLCLNNCFTRHFMYFYNRDDTPSIPHSNSSLLDSPPPSPLVSCTPNAASIMVLHHQVTSLHAHNRKVQKCATYFKAHSDRFRKKLYSTTRQAQHSKTQQQVAESELKTIQDEIKAAKKLVVDNLTMHECILADMAVKDAVHATKLQQAKGKLKRVQQDLRKLRRCGVT